MSDDSPKHPWPWLLLLVFIISCVLAILWLLAEVKRTKMIRDLNNPPPVAQVASRPDPLAILSAAKTYADGLKNRGDAVPAWVSLRELNKLRLLQGKQAGEYGGAEVFVSLTASALRPQDVLVEARFSDGTKTQVLADGSVQQRH